MVNLPWLDDVRKRLARQALPPTYVRRFMEELSDHLEDITEESMSTEADVLSRLGKPEQVAEAAVVSYRRHSFLGRHPMAAFFVFGLSPAVSLIVLSILAFAIGDVGVRVINTTAERFGLGSMNGEGYSTQPGPVTLAITRHVVSLITIVIPAVLASILYCKLAKQLGTNRRWTVVSCTMLAVAAMLPCWYIETKSISGTGHYAIMAGLWIPGLCGWIPPITFPQLIQLLAPLAIGCWFMRRKRNELRLQLAS